MVHPLLYMFLVRPGGIMKHVIFLIFLIACDQAFADPLADALTAALQSSEKDKLSKQVVLEVNPEQVEKATFIRQKKEKIVVKVEDNILDDLASRDAADAIDAKQVAPAKPKIEAAPEDNIEAELPAPVSGPVAQISKDKGDI